MKKISHRKYNTKPNKTSFKSGELNPNWKSDSNHYSAIHAWLNKHIGKPNFCEHCGNQNAKKYDWANISKLYKRDRIDWLRLCRSCHIKYDESRKKMWERRRAESNKEK